MRVEIKQSIAECGIRIIPEEEKESCAAERMTRFYNTLSEEILAYRREEASKSRSLRYNINAQQLEDSVKITLKLTLRERGRRIAEKCISHVWKNDVIIHSDTSQINI